MKIEYKKIVELIPYVNNPRNNFDAIDAVASSIKNFGFKVPIVIDNHNEIVTGHTRLLAAKKLNMENVPVIIADDLTESQVKAFRLADNKVSELSEWDDELLSIELKDLADLNFDMEEFNFNMKELNDDNYKTTWDKIKENGSDSNLLDTFVVAPFSILDTRQGNWLERDKMWKSIGIKSEIGRDENLTFSKSLNNKSLGGTSIFSPTLTEIIYRWFTPDSNSEIIDPFAGGSVRGIIAKILGHNYTGIELREDQVEANYNNAKEMGLEGITWHNDDSLNISKYAEDGTKDLLIACPPYFDLEVYSDKEQDISNMGWLGFKEVYTEIMRKTARKLKPNRFAVVVISDVRDKKTGMYHDLVGVTKEAMLEEGFGFYNDMILINNAGSAAITARSSMKNRKVRRCHQNVLVFYNGIHSEVKKYFPELKDIEDFEFEQEEQEIE